MGKQDQEFTVSILHSKAWRLYFIISFLETKIPVAEVGESTVRPGIKLHFISDRIKTAGEAGHCTDTVNDFFTKQLPYMKNKAVMNYEEYLTKSMTEISSIYHLR